MASPADQVARSAHLGGLILTLLVAAGCPSKAPENNPPPAGGAGGSGGGTAGSNTGGTSGGIPAETTGGSLREPGLHPTASQDQPGLPPSRAPRGLLVRLSHLHLRSRARQERLVTNLDDNGKDGFAVSSQIAVSPDRKWIAFGSRDFRRTPDDGRLIKRGGILWTVSVDGKQYRRLTPPITEPVHEAGYCGTTGSVCGFGEVCTAGRCIRPQLTVQYGSPVWATDGRTVYFEEQHSWICGTLSSPKPCAFALTASVRDNKITHSTSLEACISDAPIALHPTQSVLLLQRHACTTDGVSGLHEWSPDSLTGKRQIVAYTTTPHFSSQVNASAWLPDGSGVLAAVTRELKTPPSRDYKTELVQISLSGEIKTLFKPTSEDQDIEDVTVSSMGNVVVEISHTSSGQKASQLHAFDMASSTLGSQLTQAGDNQSPAF